MGLYRITGKAQQDIGDIGDFIARDNPVRALSFTREIRARIARASDLALGYRERPELLPGIRAIRHGNYLIFFRIKENVMVVTRVVHGSRDVSNLIRD